MKIPQGEVKEVVSPSEQPRVFYYEMVENTVVIGRDRNQVSSGRGITIPPEERGQVEVSEGSRLFMFNADKDAEVNIQPLPGLIPSSEFDVTPFGSPNIFRQDIQTINGVTQTEADWSQLFTNLNSITSGGVDIGIGNNPGAIIEGIAGDRKTLSPGDSKFIGPGTQPNTKSIFGPCEMKIKAPSTNSEVLDISTFHASGDYPLEPGETITISVPDDKQIEVNSDGSNSSDNDVAWLIESEA